MEIDEGAAEGARQAFSAGADAERPDIDGLVEQLRRRVVERRRAGVYPPQLESDLDAHFQRIAAHRPSPYDYDVLRARLGALDDSMGFTPARIDYGSGLPGGSALHRTIGKAVSRQTGGILEQMHAFAQAVRDVLREMVVVLEHPNGHVHAELLGQVDALMERVADFERVPPDSSLGLAELRRRIDKLEHAESKRQFRPWFGNASFEEQFRGTREELLERYTDLANKFAGCDPVVDLGCGRGEFLELLARTGADARGIEIDPVLVEDCGNRGLKVEYGDAVQWLAGAIDGSLGGISLIQVIEHLSSQDRSEVVRLAYAKLRPGGKIVIETLNPQSLYIFARAFYADPTHEQPVHPAYLDFLLKEAGFNEIAIEWRSPPPDEEVPQGVDVDGPLASQINEDLARIKRVLFGPQDYAIIASR